MGKETVVSRRDLLRTLGATATVGVTGCTWMPGTNDSGGADDGDTSTPTGTAVDGQAPTILDYRAEPRQSGGVLHVYMQGEDDRGLGQARIAYGDQELRREPDGATVTLDGVLEDTATTSPEDGRVAYVLTDTAGNETRKHVQPDSTAPELAVTAEPTDQAGRIATTIEATDDTGLAEVQALLGDTTIQSADLNGTAQYSNDPTLTAPEGQRGRNVYVGARAQDWNGNTTEKDVETYVRKYDLMEDTRLDFGAQYQPFFKEFGNFDMDGREPSIGQYDDPPYPQWVYDRHLDQMSGFGVTTVRVEILTTSEDAMEIPATEKFLSSPLADQVDIGVQYTIAGHLWLEDGDFTADNYRTDLIEPHMEYIRDNIFARDNAATHEGRPVMDIWNPEVWLWDYPKGRIMDEWGGYEALVDDIRSHLEIGGKDPFLVGGFGNWGIEGYDYPPSKELATQFDGVSTWVGGGAWGDDGFASQDEALDWIEENWQGHRAFTDDNDMDFVPMVFPGFNEVKERQRRTPRSPEFFAELMDLADEYRTTEMIWTPPYNNWEEATHYEPGTFEPGPFGEENYGTAYLEIVAEFQQGDLG